VLFRSRGACRFDDLSPGDYTIETGGSGGYQNYRGTFTLGWGDEKQIEPWTTGGLVVATTPLGANVKLSGNAPVERRGPLIIKELQPGELEVVVSQAGFGDQGRRIRIEEGKTTEVSFTLKRIAIGDYCQGGIVFSLNGKGGGLLAAPSDADGGNLNLSEAISYCHNLRVDGAGGWRLPSKTELNLLYTNLKGLGHPSFSKGSDGYWSATDGKYNYAWTQFFLDGQQVQWPKYYSARTRAVRSF
jgi:hypothetical protein